MTLSVSVITVVRNAVDTIGDTLESVSSQNYPAIEHVVVDGMSDDGTDAVIRRYENDSMTVIREPDGGLFDAMNKGLRAATGEVVGFLNGDDVFSSADSVGKIAAIFDRHKVDACFGDVVFVDESGEKILRYYRSSGFVPNRLAQGFMPAHPTLYVRRVVYQRYGNFKTDYRIAGDYEMAARLFFVHRIRYRYLPEVLVRMRTGGISTSGMRSKIVLNREILRACRENDIPSSVFKLLTKVPRRLRELVERPKNDSGGRAP